MGNFQQLRPTTGQVGACWKLAPEEPVGDSHGKITIAPTKCQSVPPYKK